MTSSRLHALRNALAIALAVVAWTAALYLLRLQSTVGPHTQAVNVRLVEGVSTEARRQFERQHGLMDGEESGTRTWTYRLADRSRANLADLVHSPVVEDTAHIDRQALRVVLDRTDVPAWARTLVEREWLPYCAWLLVIIGLVPAWSAWRGLRTTPPAFVVLFSVALVVAATCAWLYATAGPQRQLVRVRWEPRVTADERMRAESGYGLQLVEVGDGHTLTYRLLDRSAANIGRLVANPLVTDTAHIDRQRLKVLVDRPDLPGWLLWLVETDRLRELAVVFLLAGLTAAWKARANLLALGRAALHVARRGPHAHGVPTRLRAIVLGLAVVVSAVTLLSVAEERPEDSSLVHLFEATSLLAGDHPYRDFFEWGAPLPMYLSAAAQVLTGHRMIGEVALQWIFIVLGVAVAFHLGLRLSRSVPATLATMPLAIVTLAKTPTYHYTKLFCFPMAVWLGWRYVEQPTAKRGAALGVMTAVAFLFRHDYGIWTGLAAVAAFALARVAVPESRQARRMALDCGAFAAAAVITVSPWAALVQSSEGLRSYVEARAAKYESAENPFHRLLTLDPFLRTLHPPPLPPLSAAVPLVWEAGVDEVTRRQLEQQYGLQPLDGHDGEGRPRYQVSNVNDLRLLSLRPYVTQDSGFDWNRLRQAQSGRPGLNDSMLWLEQVVLLVPLLLLGLAIVTAGRSLLRAQPIPTESLHMALAGTVLAVIDWALFREPSYMVSVAPVTAALSSRFLVARGVTDVRPMAVLRIGGMGFLLLLTTYAADVWTGGLPVFGRPPAELMASVSRSLATLSASPPDGGNERFVYLRECAAPHDRLLVGGITPFYPNYYTGLPMAGGHLYWHSGWRSDPRREAESLALLERQSAPFAMSSSDPMMDDFKRYPRMREYVAKNYVELAGTDGRMLVDKRRQPVRTWGPNHYPCFR